MLSIYLFSSKCRFRPKSTLTREYSVSATPCLSPSKWNYSNASCKTTAFPNRPFFHFQGSTPLHFACEQNNITAVRTFKVRNHEMCEFLLRYPNYGAKCSINMQNNFGNSALHTYALTNNINIGCLLIDFGANPALENNNGQTAVLIILENSIHRLPMEKFSTGSTKQKGNRKIPKSRSNFSVSLVP